MIVSLGGYALSDHLVLDGLEKAPALAWSSRQTFGRTVIQLMPIKGGTPVSLISENHLTLAEVQAVNDLIAAGQDVTLVHHRGTFTVVVVGHELVPDTPVANPDEDPNTDDVIWYSGPINLIIK